MHSSKALSVLLPTQLPASPWQLFPVHADERQLDKGWGLRRLFAKKPPTLYQRCLAVHILHASEHRSLH